MNTMTYAHGCNEICKFYSGKAVDRCSNDCPLRDLDCGSMLNEDDTEEQPMNIERMKQVEDVIRKFKAKRTMFLPTDQRKLKIGILAVNEEIGQKLQDFAQKIENGVDTKSGIGPCDPPRFPQSVETNEYRYTYTPNGLIRSPAASQTVLSITPVKRGDRYRHQSMQPGQCGTSTCS